MPPRKKMIVSTETITKPAKKARVDKKKQPEPESEEEPEPEFEEQDSSSESSLHVDPDQPPSKKRTRKRYELLLADDQETGMAEWLRAHPYLYTKGDRDYRDADKKKALWQTKAQEMEVDVAALMTWFKSIRTKVGKLTKECKSGQAAHQRTDRDKFVVGNFRFLMDHIVRHPSRVACSLLKKPQTQTHSLSASDDDSDHQVDINVEEAATQDPEAEPGTSQPTETQRPRGKAKAKTPTQPDLMSTLQRQQTANNQLQGEIRTVLDTVKITEQQAWATWIGKAAEAMHPDVLDRFQQETFQLVMSYKGESKHLYQLEKDQAPQTPPPGHFHDVPNPSNLVQQYMPQQHQRFTELQVMPVRSASADMHTCGTSGPSAPEAIPTRPSNTPGTLNLSNISVGSFSDLMTMDTSPGARDGLFTPPKPQ